MICVLDGNEILDKKMLHDILAASLNFPHWYGRNLDALYDCLTDLGEDAEIRFLHEDILKEHLGEYTQSLIKVIHMSAKENTHIHVSL